VQVSCWTYCISVTVLIMLGSHNEHCCGCVCCASSGVHSVIHQDDEGGGITLEKFCLAVVSAGADRRVCSGGEGMGCWALNMERSMDVERDEKGKGSLDRGVCIARASIAAFFSRKTRLL
jgi:hypothetical protein